MCMWKYNIFQDGSIIFLKFEDYIIVIEIKFIIVLVVKFIIDHFIDFNNLFECGLIFVIEFEIKVIYFEIVIGNRFW